MAILTITQRRILLDILTKYAPVRSNAERYYFLYMTGLDRALNITFDTDAQTFSAALLHECEQKGYSEEIESDAVMYLAQYLRDYVVTGQGEEVFKLGAVIADLKPVEKPPTAEQQFLWQELVSAKETQNWQMIIHFGERLESSGDKHKEIADWLLTAYQHEAQLLYNNKDYKQAIELYSKAIAVQKTASLYFHRGLAYEGLKRTSKDGNDLDFYRGLAYKGLKRTSEDGNNLDFYQLAIDDYTHAIELDNSSPTYQSARASAYKSCKQYDKAIEDYRQSISLYQSSKHWTGAKQAIAISSCYGEISDCYNRQGDQKRAEIYGGLAVAAYAMNKELRDDAINSIKAIPNTIMKFFKRD